MNKISPNDTLVRTNTRNLEEVSYKYELTAKDSIKVIRNWAVPLDIKTTTHKFHFSNQDTLELSQFIAVSIGTTGFEDVKLHKIAPTQSSY